MREDTPEAKLKALGRGISVLRVLLYGFMALGSVGLVLLFLSDPAASYLPLLQAATLAAVVATVSLYVVSIFIHLKINRLSRQ